MNITVKQIRAVSPRTPVLLEIDENNRVERVLADKQHLGKHDIAAEFEELYKETLNLELEKEKTHMRYKDPKADLIFKAFKLAFEEQRKAVARAIGRTKKGTIKGPYIIGMQVDDNTVQFGYRPFKHRTFDQAIKQAGVLTARHNKRYTVFVALEDVGTQPITEVAETKQKEKGRLVRSPFKVLEELQAIWCVESVNTSCDMPVYICPVNSDVHKFKVCFMYSEDLYFASYPEAINCIDQWITLYKKARDAN